MNSGSYFQTLIEQERTYESVLTHLIFKKKLPDCVEWTPHQNFDCRVDEIKDRHTFESVLGSNEKWFTFVRLQGNFQNL